MKDYLRYDKFSFKLLFVYAFGVVLLGLANPPESWSEPHVIVGVSLMVFGELVRIWAAGHLRKNQELTTSGPYSFVKNPLYIGTILITIGTCILVDERAYGPVWLMYYNWILLGVAIGVFLVYYIPYKKKREGNRLHDKFGEDWKEYDHNVPDYFPRLTPYRKVGSSDKTWSMGAYLENSEQWTTLLVAVIVLLIVYKEHAFSLFGLPV